MPWLTPSCSRCGGARRSRSRRFATLAEALHTRDGLKSIVVWGPGEEALARAVAAGAPGAVLLAPATSIVDLVALVGHATVVISGETGPTHVAAALGTP